MWWNLRILPARSRLQPFGRIFCCMSSVSGIARALFLYTNPDCAPGCSCSCSVQDDLWYPAPFCMGGEESSSPWTFSLCFSVLLPLNAPLSLALTLTLAVCGVFLCAWSNHVVEQYKWNMVLSSTMEGCILPAAWHAGKLLLFSEASKGERFPFSPRKKRQRWSVASPDSRALRGGALVMFATDFLHAE